MKTVQRCRFDLPGNPDDLTDDAWTTDVEGPPPPVVAQSLFGQPLTEDDLHATHPNGLRIVKENKGAKPLAPHAGQYAASDPVITTSPTDFLPGEADRLLQELAETDETWAAGSALYGSFGHFDHLRKSKLAIVELQIKDAYQGEKVTETQIDREARASDDYRTFLDEHTKHRALWLILDQQREQIKTQLKLLTYTRADR